MTRNANDPSVRVRATYTYVGFGQLIGHSTQVLADTNVYVGQSYAYAGFEYIAQPRTRIAIDLNVRVRGNDTYAGFEDATGPLTVGETVEVYEPESGLAGEGRITELDGERELVFLSVDWASLTDEPSRWHGPSTPPAQLLYIPPQTAGTAVSDPWTTLVSTPCLAQIGSAETTLWVTAPVATTSAEFLTSGTLAPHLEIRQLKVGFDHAWVVAA